MKSSIFKFGHKMPGSLEVISTTCTDDKGISRYSKTNKATILVSVWDALKVFEKSTYAREGMVTVAPSPLDKGFISYMKEKDSDSETFMYASNNFDVIRAVEHNLSMDTYSDYNFGASGRHCTQVFLTLLPKIISDSEANECYEALKKYLLLEPDSEHFDQGEVQDDIKINLAKLSDNIYQRITYPTKCEDVEGGSSIPFTTPASGTFLRMKKEEVDSLLKAFTTFPTITKKKRKKSRKSETSDFNGSFELSPGRKWTNEEKELIPVMEDWYEVPEWVRHQCCIVKNTSKMRTPIHTFMLCGEAGSGKTEGAKAIFAGLGIPHLIMTCHEDTDAFDLLGQVFPNTGKSEVPIATSSILEEAGLPSFEDVSFDCKATYKRITGKEATPLTDEGEVLALLFSKALEFVKTKLTSSSTKGEKDFRYVESPLIRAVKNGWGIEIQEPNAIKRAGILVGLNALLECGDNSVISLPTDEIIKKHKDCIIIMTTNTDYVGLKLLNQSVLSRQAKRITIPTPSDKEMKNRIIKMTSFPAEQDEMLDKMLRVIRLAIDYSVEHDITDGVCGMRELESWINSCLALAMEMEEYEITDEIAREEAITSVITKVSQDTDAQAAVRTASLDVIF